MGPPISDQHLAMLLFEYAQYVKQLLALHGLLSLVVVPSTLNDNLGTAALSSMLRAAGGRPRRHQRGAAARQGRQLPGHEERVGRYLGASHLATRTARPSHL